MASPVDLAHLEVGDRMQGPLVVLAVRKQQSGQSPFTILTLGNRTGRIETAPFWFKDAAQIAGIAPGHRVEVIGHVTVYRAKRQLKVTSIRVVPG